MGDARATVSIPRTWRLLDTGSSDAAGNMALDERLLAEAAAPGGLPVLRFYTWDPPAVSLGRFQDEGAAVDREACRRQGIDVVRRVTGGRAVLHLHELTYSITARSDDGLFPDDVMGTYRVIARGLLAGLRGLGLPAEMAAAAAAAGAGRDRKQRPAACFAAPSHYELLVHGRKIIGSAQRRQAGAFLQHGSILLAYDSDLESAVIPGGGRLSGVTSLRQELGRAPSLDEVKRSFRDGFSSALGIFFV